jgi:hypothetical protein
VSPGEEFLGEVNSWELSERARDRWPFLRVVAPGFVDRVELGRYLRGLLASGRWLAVRAVPRAGPEGLSVHVFDLYGQPADARCSPPSHGTS